MELDRLFPYRNGATRRIDPSKRGTPRPAFADRGASTAAGAGGIYMLVGTFPSTPFT